MMKIKLALIFLLAIGISFITDAQDFNKTQMTSINKIQDDALGISFSKVGAVINLDSLAYEITLSSPDNSSFGSAIAKITKSDRLFIDLPGSYGGRMYFDSPAAKRLSQDMIMADSVDNGQHRFRREYWAVYAGMGMWDCVINTYIKEKDHYYIVSLVQEKPLGKPGLLVDGKSLRAENLKLKALTSLQDKNSDNVEKFNELLSSFQIHN